MRPLDQVRQTAEKYHAAVKAQQDARDKLAQAIRDARLDGVPMTRISEAAGLPRRTAKLIADSKD